MRVAWGGGIVDRLEGRRYEGGGGGGGTYVQLK